MSAEHSVTRASTIGTAGPALGIDAQQRSAPPSATRTAEPIAWRISRPLKWSDFQGSVPSNADPGHAAMTTATLSLSVVVKSTSSQRGAGPWTCEVVLGSVKADAAFEPSKSWVRAGSQRPDLLAHEQIHFDLAHIQAVRAPDAVLRALRGRSFSATAPTEEAALKAARAKLDRELEPLLAAQHQELEERNRQYDAETAHGAKQAEQKRWSDRIERELLDLGVPRRKR